jgi:hypothetical protein
METLKLSLYKAGQTKPDTVVTIPLGVLPVSINLVPRKIQTALEKHGIDLGSLNQLVGKKSPRGTLIEIEQGNERMVIGVE